VADLSKTVEIIFGAKDNVTTTVKSLESQFKSFDAAVKDVAAPMADVANKILAVETAVLALSAAFVGKAIDAAGTFGDSVREIGTLFGGTSEQVGQFGTDIQNYAATSTQSIESINGAIYEAISSGVKYEDSIKFINEAEKLAVAGRADLTQVTDVLTGTLNAYGASTAEAANYTDDLLTAVNLGKTTVPELAASLANVTSIAAAAGVPFSDLSAAVAGVTASGKPTAEAITAIRGVLETFVSPSGAAAKAAAELGLSLDTTTLRSDGLQGALKKIYEATGGTVEGLSKIFTTTEGLQGALVLGADKSGIFAEALKQMETNSGLTAKAFETMSQNYEVATQRMANAADVALIKAGQPLLDEFGSVANGIAAVFQNLGKGIDSGAFDPIINALEAFGASAADTLANIARNLPEALEQLDFSPLIRSFDSLGSEVKDAFTNIFGEIDLETPEGLAQALQKIVNGIAALTNVTAGIIDGLDPVFKAFGGIADASINAGEGAQKAVGEWLGAAQIIVEFGTKMAAAVIALDEFSVSFTRIFDVLFGTVRAIFNAVEIAVEGFSALVLATVYDIFSALGKLPDALGGGMWRDAAESVKGTFNNFKLAVKNDIDDLNSASDQLARGFSGVGTATGEAATNADAFSDAAAGAAEQGQKFVGIDWSQSATGIDYVGEAAKRLGLTMGEAKPGFDEFGKYIKTAGDESDIARAKTNGYRLEIDELGNRTFIPVIEGQKKTNAELRTAQKEMEAAAKKAVEYDLKLREIESKERIAFIEAKFKVDEEQIKADAAKVVAAFESINTSITSTGETLTGLVGSWAALAGTFEGAKLWDLIENEEKRRQEAFAQQKELVAEQIQYMKARTKTLERGDTLIKVNADGVAPELERIFHEILRRCQVKANEQGLELLLAGGA
jgi:TP901 family phage tail tape measure protein